MNDERKTKKEFIAELDALHGENTSAKVIAVHWQGMLVLGCAIIHV